MMGVASFIHPVGWCEGGDHRFDVAQGDGGLVQQQEGFAAVGAGEGVADGVAGVLDLGEEIVGEEMAVPDQQEMGFGEAAEAGAGEGGVGLPLSAVVIRRIGGDLGQRAGQGGEVAGEDFAEQGMQIDEVAAQRGGGDAQGGGEVGKGDGMAAVAGHERPADGEDAFVPLPLPFGAEVGAAFEGVGLGAEDAGVDVHGAHVRYYDVFCQ